MANVVVCAEGLGKKYTIGHLVQRERYAALRDVISRGARNAWRNTANVLCGRVMAPAIARRSSGR